MLFKPLLQDDGHAYSVRYLKGATPSSAYMKPSNRFWLLRLELQSRPSFGKPSSLKCLLKWKASG